MSETVTKTLAATLAPPTQGKKCRLQRLMDTYREALAESFDAHADTMTAVNDIVTPYDLPYQAKDALKSYVPKLFNTYDAQEIHDEHPLRLVNRAATFDHSAERVHEVCWQVPQPGRGTNFWIPLRINPDQASLWADLLDGEAEAGELRLQRHRRNWELHVTVHYSVEEPDDTDDQEPTYIGFDIGEAALITGCALKRETPTEPMIISGSRARHLRKEMFMTLKRLQERDASQWRIDERFEHYQNALTDILEKATRRAIEYANQFDNPVIALEDLTYIREHLDCGKFMNHRLHAWAFARLQGRIEDKAADAGIPVKYVNAAYTSQTCHACNRLENRRSQGAFWCPYDDCHITEFHADINATATIAARVDPWGESLPWKPAGRRQNSLSAGCQPETDHVSGDDDIPQDGSGCDTATRHAQEQATNGVATQISARSGRDDNGQDSRSSGTAGTGQMTLRSESWNLTDGSESHRVGSPVVVGLCPTA